jgi:hypothetical protein
MRVKWILAGVVGTSAALSSAVAMASPTVSFQTILNNLDGTGDSIPGTGDNFGSAQQVVVGDGGNVAVLGELENDSDPVIIYNTPSGASRNNLAIVDATAASSATPTTINDWGADKTDTTSLVLSGLDNLALTSNPSSGIRLSFAAVGGAGDGVLQADITGPTASPSSTLGDVAFDGDGQGYSIATLGGPADGVGTVEMQVNGSGQVLFPASVSATNVLARGDVSGVATQFTSTTPLAVQDPQNRVALAADNTGAAILTASSVNGVYSLAANGSSQSKVSASAPPDVPTDPEALLGYYSSGGNSAALWVTPAAGGTQNIELEKNNGTPAPILTLPVTTSSSPVPISGEMTPNGKIAVYVPDSTNGDTIKYEDTTAISPLAATIASVATPSETTVTAPASAIALDPTASNLLIEGLQDNGTDGAGSSWVPEVNSGGTVVFNALVGLDSTRADDKIALLDWNPLTGGSPTILIAEGDQLMIGGQEATIETFDPPSQDNTGLVPNILANENDYYKNALSDDGYLAVNVNYYLTDDPSSTGTAVLLTQLTSPSSPVPEPATLGLLSLSGLTLLGRRRR